MTTRPMTTRLRKLSAGMGFAAVATLATALAPTASAAPADVIVSPSVAGNAITLKVSNNAAKRIGCEIFGVKADTSPTASGVVFGYQTPEQLGALISPGTSKNVPMRVTAGTPPKPTGSTTIPDGTYDIYWGCATITLPPGTAREQFWGTNPPLTNMTPTAGAPIRVSVPGAGPTAPEPEPETPARPTVPGFPDIEIPEQICAPWACYPVPLP
ncbi:hypothetical protein RD149_09575 [Gordonia westfalica]|uniref:Secreted protein n=1 Tax=Gordonia westfalica TaxID=158898 RepID=A0ABU2GSV5_9ACTN|nr:hypothetical protein [Gordonia westfalica]MDS1114019.1 hypothetical protein [Gordonia westfalica]